MIDFTKPVPAVLHDLDRRDDDIAGSVSVLSKECRGLRRRVIWLEIAIVVLVGTAVGLILPVTL